MSHSAALAVAAAALLLAAAPIEAQQPLALDRGERVTGLRAGPVLDDEALREAVTSGLPLRLRFRLELWRDELFDQLEGHASWTVLVAYDPLEQTFRTGLVGDSALASYDSWAELRAAIERTYRPSIALPADGRFYHIGVLEIETLSLSDLGELERWLRGELEPAVRGRRSVGSALGTGLRRLFIRVLGLPARQYEVRGEPFRVP